MPWWSWIITGLVLLVLELATPGGFFLCFFGFSGLLVGLLAWAHVLEAEAAQWATFSVVAILLIAFGRKRFLAMLPGRKTKDDTDSFVGKSAVASETIAPAAIGNVDFRGTTWTARNVGSARIESGATCEIIAIEGLTLSVKSA